MPNHTGRTSSDDPEVVTILALRIRSAAEAVARFAAAYEAADPLDTSSDERERLAMADRLLQEVLDLFV